MLPGAEGGSAQELGSAEAPGGQSEAPCSIGSSAGGVSVHPLLLWVSRSLGGKGAVQGCAHPGHHHLFGTWSVPGRITTTQKHKEKKNICNSSGLEILSLCGAISQERCPNAL